MDLSVLDFELITLVMGVLGTFWTALVTKYESGDLVKGLASITWAVAIAAVTPLVDAGELPVSWAVFVQDAASIWVTGLLAWLGITSEWNARVNLLTAHFGLGRFLV